MTAVLKNKFGRDKRITEIAVVENLKHFLDRSKIAQLIFDDDLIASPCGRNGPFEFEKLPEHGTLAHGSGGGKLVAPRLPAAPEPDIESPGMGDAPMLTEFSVRTARVAQSAGSKQPSLPTAQPSLSLWFKAAWRYMSDVGTVGDGDSFE
ncbi:hypothetical protein SDC9_130389 [bioreactor metagenome]|uniref:Uncharacterized protein n=1 Tax=bioreactor metagenome TaxID=1076179 RepID=A0A645D2C2_9ZZZZ